MKCIAKWFDFQKI